MSNGIAELPIERLNLSPRTYLALKCAGVNTIDDVQRKRRREVIQMRGMGINGTDEIERKLFRLTDEYTQYKVCATPKSVDISPITIGDHIRSLPNDQLAEFLCKNFCKECSDCPGRHLCELIPLVSNGLIKYLNQPYMEPKHEN